ncbi:MAG: hypothetical protein E7164_00730 [Firmicutes bacterium]|nr:hypothetical protein [Bacillota bacterium]
MNDLWNNRDWTPMLLNERQKPFISTDYLFEIKFDGSRAIVFASPNEVNIINRRKQDVTYLYPELINIKKVVKRNTIFDGEIIALDNGAPSFSKLQNRLHLKNKQKINIQQKNNPVIFVCFDILYDAKNVINHSLKERKKILDKYPENDVFIKANYVFTNGEELFKFTRKKNLEGIVAKKIDSKYEVSVRSECWFKVKNIKEGNFFVGGYVNKEKSFSLSLLLGEFFNNSLNYVGKVTISKKSRLFKKIISQPKLKKSPFVNYENSLVIYIKPTLVCRVKYLERTKENRLRQPILISEEE